MTDQPVKVSRRGAVQLIAIDRPEARNAVNLAVAEAIAAALEELDSDGELRAGVLTGEGGNFSAGMDLKAFARGEAPFIEGRGFAGLAQRSADKPLIAAIEGNALAGGLEIALACDLIVASEEARLGIPEAKRGLVAAGGALIRLPKRIPYHVAMELALTGDPISAARGAELGLVNRLAPAGGALDAALELAEGIARNGPLALQASKRVVRGTLDWSEGEAWERQQEFTMPVFTSEDAQEGARAFAEKREPVWRGQ